MKKITLLLMSVLASGYAFAQTDTSGRNFYRATPEKKTALRHTKLKVDFNFSNQTLNGEEWLTAAPFFYPSDSLILDAKTMLIHQVALEQHGKLQNLPYSYKDDLLRIKLPKKYQKDENYTVYIKYTAQPEKVPNNGNLSISDTKGLYFINPEGKPEGYPRQIWTQGEAESSSCWFPTIDKPNQKTTQEIEMTVPDSFVTLSNGLLKSSQKNGNLRTDYWVMDKPHAPYLFFMGAGEFAVVKDTPWRGKVPVEYYVEKDYAPLAKKLFGNTPEMISFFSERFGYDYPWAKYAQIIVRDFVTGAMENTTAVSHSESAYQSEEALNDQNYWEYIIAHELAHHWFGDLVTAESWANLTVNESFANYSEYLWLAHKYGKDVADYHLRNNTQQYHQRPDDFKKDLVRFDYTSTDDMFDMVSYNKGGAILHMLRHYLGDEAFFQGVTNYLKAYAYGNGEAHQLRLSFEKISGKDLSWFFNQWYFGYGNPTVKVEKHYDATKKQLTVKITQLQSEDLYFQFPLDIDIYQDNKPIRHTVWVNARQENAFTFAVSKAPALVNINPEGVVVMEEQYPKTIKEYLFQIQHAPELKSRLEAISYLEAGKGKEVVLAALRDPYFKIRKAALELLEGYQLTKKDLALVEKIATSDPENLARAAAIWVLNNQEDKRYTALYEKALTIPSAAIKNAALDGIARTNPSRAKQFLEKANPADLEGDQLLGFVSVITQYKMDKYLPAMMPYLVNYSFLVEDDPQRASDFKKAYLWAMSLDNTSLVQQVQQALKDYTQEENDEKVKQDLAKMLDEGIAQKKKLPDTATVKEQIQMLEELKSKIK
nr:M1 family aminopeptidase [uncultured Capnocytophaga sp.]